MKQSKINRLKAIHEKVIHSYDYTDKEYLEEDKELKKLNNALLSLLCEQCFPLATK